MCGQSEELLRRLAVNDEKTARAVLALRPERREDALAGAAGLTPRIRMLVRLAALVALDAPTTSLRWAVELASCAGADIDELVGVLTAVGPEVGLPRVVDAAPRLAAAIGYDVRLEGWDGS